MFEFCDLIGVAYATLSKMIVGKNFEQADLIDKNSTIKDIGPSL